MKYAERILTVPSEITNDPISKMEVYRLALFVGDIGWHDVLVASKEIFIHDESAGDKSLPQYMEVGSSRLAHQSEGLP